MNVVKMFCSNGDKNFEIKTFGLYYDIYKSTYIKSLSLSNKDN